MSRMVLNTSVPQDRVVRVVNVHRSATAKEMLDHLSRPHLFQRRVEGIPRPGTTTLLTSSSKLGRIAWSPNSSTVINGQIVAQGENVADTASAPSSSSASFPDVSNLANYPALGGDKGKQAQDTTQQPPRIPPKSGNSPLNLIDSLRGTPSKNVSTPTRTGGTPTKSAPADQHPGTPASAPKIRWSLPDHVGEPVVSEQEWYDFSPYRRAETEREQQSRERNVDRINRNAGMEKEA
ncbi:hypothetical protein CC86DRAFT_383349 [Ophiobolus disseminans]|uniref:Uncharacterized protein n=1 Tax=Ophiobolus disseminans TaxID=1469910 RepID=A0A6A6ZYT2_9PLEO|nr:hypothetical protein CC86DRAFT_383349 [Ophiobolus disseminans]